MAKKAKKKSPPDTSVSVPASKKAKKKKAPAEDIPRDDLSRCIALCQEQRWREALLLSRQGAREVADGNEDAFPGLGPAETKVEFSLRRQMASSLVVAAKKMLAKEYLLDVGE